MSLSEGQFGAMAKRARRLRLDDQECAYGQCRTASADFQRLHGGEVVEFGGPRDTSTSHEEWQAMGEYEPDDLKHSRHAVNKVGNNIVDWTASQFWSRSPLPLIEPIDVYKKRFRSGPHPPAWQAPYQHGDYSAVRKEMRGDY